MIAGGGWIGLEVAAAARGYGAEVTVVEADPTPLHRVLGPELGQLFADLHSDHGVRFHFGARLTEIVGQDGLVLAVRTDDGEEHPAHAVLAAIGAAPAPPSPRTPDSPSSTGPTAAASPSTSPCAPPTPTSSPPGTWPPHTTRSCAPGCASSTGPTPRRRPRRRPRHARQARLVRPRALLLHRPVRPGHGVLGLGAPGSYDQVVVRGDTGKREFIAFWLKEGRVLAGMNVNVWDVTEPIQNLVRSRMPVDPEALADPSVPLDGLI